MSKGPEVIDLGESSSEDRRLALLVAEGLIRARQAGVGPDQLSSLESDDSRGHRDRKLKLPDIYKLAA